MGQEEIGYAEVDLTMVWVGVAAAVIISLVVLFWTFIAAR